MAINHEQINFDRSSLNLIKQNLQQVIKDKANSLHLKTFYQKPCKIFYLARVRKGSITDYHKPPLR